MAKLRIEARYGIVPNALLNSTNLTLKAKGLFAFIQSKPDGWSFSAKKIAIQCKESHVAVLSGLKELENAGYLIRNKTRRSDGKWSHEYVLIEQPRSRNLTTENPTTEKPTTENMGHNSKQDKVNKISKKEKDIAGASPADPINEVLSCFHDKMNPTINFANKTQRGAVQDLLGLMGKDKLINMINFCAEIKDTPYAPVVTTPYKLKTKLADVIAYKNRQNKENEAEQEQKRKEERRLANVCNECFVSPCVC